MNHLIQRRDWGQHQRDSHGYPTGEMGWSVWYTTIDFEQDEGRANNICKTLNDCAVYCTKETHGRRRSEFRVAKINSQPA